MREIARLQFISILCLIVSFLCLPAIALAASNGVAGDEIVDMLTKLLKDNTLAVAIYTTIAGIIGIGLRILLKKIPTGMQTIVGMIFWKVAAALFGDGVVLEKNKDMDYVKGQLIKKYPLLQIDLKKPF